MDNVLMEICDLFAENRQALCNAYKWDSGLMNLAAACIPTSLGKKADMECIRKCEAILKARTGVFSEMRGNVKTALLCRMSLADDGEKYFDMVEDVYRRLNKSRWMGSEYKILAAMTICDHSYENADEYILRTNEIYERMKKEHKWLTSHEDIPFAAMLAVSDRDIDEMSVEMEKIFDILKCSFSDSNAVQSLSHVLTLESSGAEEKCRRVTEIFAGLKDAHHTFGAGYELAVIGTLAMLPLSVDDIVQQVIDADDYLKSKDGFGSLSLGDTARRMYAALMVINVFRSHDSMKDNTVLSSMLSMTIAVEICMIIMITTCINTAVYSN